MEKTKQNQIEKVETKSNNNLETITKNGNLSVKKSHLLGLASDYSKTDLAKKVKDALKDALIFKFENGNIKTTLTNTQMEIFNNYFKIEIFDNNPHTKQYFIEMMQQNTKTYLKNMYIDALASAYNSNGLKKDKDSNTETIAKYGKTIAKYSFAKFVQNVVEKVLTRNGKYFVVYNSITKQITYEICDEVVEGIEE